MSGLRRKAGKFGPPNTNKRIKKSIDLAWTNNDNAADDEVIESDDDEFLHEKHTREGYSDQEEEEEEETVEAKRVRLARQYLEKIEAEESDSSSDEEEDEEELSARDRIGRKLQKDRMKRQGTYERAVAQTVADDVALMKQEIHKAMPTTAEEEATAWIAASKVRYLRGHDLTPTCVALQTSGDRALSGSKDNSVILWDVENCKRLHNVCPQWKTTDMEDPRGNGEVLAIAYSDDGRFAAVGRRDATVNIFDVRLSGKTKSTNLITSFKGHKGPVTSLSFRTQSLQLFSGSEDRCIR